VPIKPDPWRKKGPEKAIAEGERVYHGVANCNGCHPSYADKPTIVEDMKAYDITPGFRDDMYSSVEKESDWGAPIKPPDFLVDRTKSADTKEELVRVIAAGVGGTAMPSWGETTSSCGVSRTTSSRSCACATPRRGARSKRPSRRSPPTPSRRRSRRSPRRLHRAWMRAATDERKHGYFIDRHSNPRRG
jgi:hypothetical protein